MNDDELIERLRRTLRSEADAIDPDRGANRVSPLARRSSRRAAGPRVVAGLAVAAVIAAAVLVATNLTGHRASTTINLASPTTPTTPVTRPARISFTPASTTTTPPSTAPATTTPTTTQAPAVVRVGSDFVPQSATFVSADEGWVLGIQHCSGAPCLTLAHTVDGGHTWAVGPTPATAVAFPTTGGAGPELQVRFATHDEGWIFGTVGGRPVVWATLDGGAVWTPQTLPGLTSSASIAGLETAQGLVHVVGLSGTTFVIDTAQVGTETWTRSPVSVPVGGSPVPQAGITLQQSGGWIVENDRVVAGGAELGADGAWRTWRPPCTRLSGPAYLAASTASDLAAVCDTGLFNGTAHNELFVSSDGGARFTPAGAVPSGVASIASPVASTVVGTVTGSGAIDATFDGGASWRTVYDAPGQTITQVGFENAQQGVAISGAAGSPAGQLLMTRDGGHTWTAVDLGT